MLPLAVVIGLIMATIFDRETGTSEIGLAGATISITAEDREERPAYVTTFFLALLVGVLFGATSNISLVPKVGFVTALALASAWW